VQVRKDQVHECATALTVHQPIKQKGDFMTTSTTTESNNETRNWPDLAIGLYERLTGRGAEIVYDFRNMEVQVPDKVGPSAVHTLWKVNGVVIIRTCENNVHTDGGGK